MTNKIGTVTDVGVVLRSTGSPMLLARALASVKAQVYESWTLYVIFDSPIGPECQSVLDGFDSWFARLIVLSPNPSLNSNTEHLQRLAYILEDRHPYLVHHADSDVWDPSFLYHAVRRLNADKKLSACGSTYRLVEEHQYRDTALKIQDHGPTFEAPAGPMSMVQILSLPVEAQLRIVIRREYLDSVEDFVFKSNSTLLVALAIQGPIYVLSKCMVTVHVNQAIRPQVKDDPEVSADDTLTRKYLEADSSRLGLLALVSQNQKELREELKAVRTALAAQVELTGARFQELEAQIRALKSVRPWWAFWRRK